LNASASTTFARPEDGAWDPNDPRKYYFVTTNRLDTLSDGLGSQIGSTRLWRLTFDDITNPDSGGTIDLLVDGDTVNGRKVNMFDNITIDRFGHIILQEDVGNAAHNGKIWQYDIATDTLKFLAQHDVARFGDVGVSATAPFSTDEETSGVIDMQEILGPGTFAFVDQAHYSTGDTTTVEGGQLLLMFNPDTYKSYQPDFINTSQTIVFSPGETAKDVTVPIYGDNRLEGNETLSLNLINPSAGSAVGSIQPSATLTIQDCPTLSISPLSADKQEGNIGSTPFTFTVSRSGDTSIPVSFSWEINPSGNQPASASDFAGGLWPSGTVVLAGGETSHQITINVVGDATFEPTETFSISLAGATGANLLANAAFAEGRIQNDDIARASYTFTATPNPVFEGGNLAVGVSTSNVAAGSQLFWSFSGPGITSADFSDGALHGVSLIGADGRAAFSKAIAADGVVDPNEQLELRFYIDQDRTQPAGSVLNVMIKEPTVGVVTDGNDIITGTNAAELISGIPSPSTLRGRGSLDQLTGGGGNDIFMLADSQAIFYDDGTTRDGSMDLAVISDFTSGDRIQLFGNSSNYALVSGRYNGIRGIRIDSIAAPGSSAEVIGFVQGANLASLNLANTAQFLYI
jgi:hypothetical protein